MKQSKRVLAPATVHAPKEETRTSINTHVTRNNRRHSRNVLAPAAPAARKIDPKDLPPVHLEKDGNVNNTIINAKKQPPINNMARRGSNGSKRHLYGIFECSYADWTKFARYIANGQYSNVFEKGVKPSANSRMYWLTKTDPVSEEETWVATLTSQEAKNHDLKQDETIRIALNLDESLPKIAYHEQFRNLGEKYENQNKYAGFVCTFRNNIEAVQENVRNFIAINPEYDEVFGELETYESIYIENADKLEPLKNLGFSSNK